MSDYETTQRRRNVIVGIFVIAGFVALGWMVFKFRDLPLLISKMNSFKLYVQFPSAPGIQQDTPVRFCGYPVGKVAVIFAPEILKDLKTGLTYHQTKVVMRINKKYVNIPSNVQVKLMSRGLGSSYIELKVDPTAPLQPLEPNKPESIYLYDGACLQGSTGMTSEFFPEESQKKFEQLIKNFNDLISNANEIISDMVNNQNLKVILVNLSDATNQATKALKDFQKFSAAGTKTLQNADDRIAQLTSVFIHTSEQITKTANELTAIAQKVNQGPGSAAKILNDGRLYENLLENTQKLQLLFDELRELINEIQEKGLRSVY